MLYFAGLIAERLHKPEVNVVLRAPFDGVALEVHVVPTIAGALSAVKHYL
jgi:hypothetical protein